MSRYSSIGDRAARCGVQADGETLHAAGLEVILDVVYNHTCEGNHMGPTLSWRGRGNTTYYRLVEGDPQFYMDYTGTGNTLNVRNPQVLKMIMDSLRYWVSEMHVDGFRFDLSGDAGARTARCEQAVLVLRHDSPGSNLADVKLIAEPWDVGDGGYQVGQFPVLWAEWNGKYRDTVRRFWKGDSGMLSDFAYRLTGSSDLYQFDGRKPYASINFITAHDGFTLCDLVSYNQKHNEANLDDNTMARQQRLLEHGRRRADRRSGDQQTARTADAEFSGDADAEQGVPMLLGGDEFARSQRGNNNCYCQDNELTWFDWNLDDCRKRLRDFTGAPDSVAAGPSESASQEILSGPRDSKEGRRQPGARGQRRGLVQSRRQRNRRRSVEFA
jgi:isoamylase